MINIDILFQQQIDYLCVAFTDRIVDRELTQFILCTGVHSLLKKELYQSEGPLLVLDCASFKQRCLQKVGGIVAQSGHIEAVGIYHVDDLFTVAFRELFEKLAHDNRGHRWRLQLGGSRLAALNYFLLKLNFLVGISRHYILL